MTLPPASREPESISKGILLSLILHVLVSAALVVGLPSLSSKPLPIPWRPVPIDIVTIGDITNTNIGGAKPQESQPPTPEKVEEKTPEPPPEPPKPQPSKQENSPPNPEPPKPKQQSDDAEAIAPLKKKQDEPNKPPTPVKAEQKKPESDPLASVLKNVAKLKPTTPATPQNPSAPTKPNQAQSAANQGVGDPNKPGGFGPSLSDRLSITQEDLLRRQIGQCWNMPIGARNAEELIVEVLIEVNPDRTVRSAVIVDEDRAARDPFFRAAAEAALRALRHPNCTPLELPPDRYEDWKTIRFNFDPRDML